MLLLLAVKVNGIVRCEEKDTNSNVGCDLECIVLRAIGGSPLDLYKLQVVLQGVDLSLCCRLLQGQ